MIIQQKNSPMSSFFYRLIALCFIAVSTQAQNDLTAYIQKNAVPLQSLTQNSEAVYALIKGKKAILVGEIHGSNEAAEFTQGIVESLLAHQQDVILGLEYPADKQQDIQANKLTQLIANWERQFQLDGRCSQAWLALVQRYRLNAGVQIKFIDQTSQQKNLNTDSCMAVNLLQAASANPQAVLVTLTGNIHNKLNPFRGQKTMGCFLATHLGSTWEQLVSVNHWYGSGSVVNNTGAGLVRRSVADRSGPYGQATSYSNYYLPITPIDGYTAILFTRTISPAKLPD